MERNQESCFTDSRKQESYFIQELRNQKYLTLNTGIENKTH